MDDRADLAQRLSDLPAEKRELLRKLLANKAATSAALVRRAPGTRIPLSFTQRRLWILDQLVERQTYNENTYFPIRAAVNLPLLRRAVNDIIRRHEILRTTFHAGETEPYQQVHDVLEIDIPMVEVRGADRAQREKEALRMIAEACIVPFDLETGPLVRGVLYRLDPNDHFFAMTLHHIVCDGWSFGVIATELSVFYGCHLLGRESPLLELPVQYGDFAIWQRTWFSEDRLNAQIAYWRAQLAGIRPLELPTDRPRPAHFTYRGSQLPVSIEGDRFRALNAIAEHQNATLHIALLAALFILLHRYTGEDDLAIGAPISGRTRKELEGLIGFFVNTQVIRVDLSGDPSFLELLARVRQICFAAYANPDVPFDRLVTELAPPRDASRSPFVQILFELFQSPSAAGVDKQYILPIVMAPPAASKFDLVLALGHYDDHARGIAEYNTDLFDEERIRRMFAHFDCLLESIASDPARPISRLSLLPASEREALDAWNDTAVDYPRDSNLYEQFRLQAERHASRIAVEYGGATMTYDEVRRRADALAAQLIAQGLKPGDCVGLLMTRSLELPAAMIGILATGTFYVPLDPRYPPDYLAYQARDSGARAIVTTEALQSAAPPDLPRIVTPTFSRTEGRLPVGAPSPESIAWLLYTSGTTGKPKGVPITHRAALRLVYGLDAAPVTPDDVVLQFSPITFDASVGEIWYAFLNGAKLVVHPPEVPSVEDLAAFIRENRITWTFLTTSLFRQLIESCPADLRGVRHLLTGGEVMAPGVMESAWKALPRTKILHMYGPTECTTFATWYHVAGVEPIRDIVPIGKPLGNTTVFILDPHGNPAPIGIPGELYIGGPGVSPGYWNRPDLNARSFVPDPSNPGAKLYRTGDMARFRADGNLEFLGRRDRQVKISGFRIELGELEAAVVSHPDVAAAHAFLIEHDGDKRLAAFAETLPGRRVEAADLRAHLEANVPRHMMPAHLHAIERLPLTAHGKVDTAALTKIIESSDDAQTARVEPSTALEKMLADLWKEILHVHSVGLTDDFFACGGQSLVATRLLSRARQTFQGSVTMREFFDDPTIRGLAAALGKDPRVHERAELLTKVGSLASAAH